jgi:predicted  nucleic acid-binding Zn-ribbon protein
METSMAQKIDKQLSQELWAVSQNISNFEDKLKAETDARERELLEGLIVLEKATLDALRRAP